MACMIEIGIPMSSRLGVRDIVRVWHVPTQRSLNGVFCDRRYRWWIVHDTRYFQYRYRMSKNTRHNPNDTAYPKGTLANHHKEVFTHEIIQFLRDLLGDLGHHMFIL